MQHKTDDATLPSAEEIREYLRQKEKERTFLSVKQLATRFSVSVPSIWRWTRDTDFPKPIKLTPSCTRWRLEDVEAWEAEREVA